MPTKTATTDSVLAGQNSRTTPRMSAAAPLIPRAIRMPLIADLVRPAAVREMSGTKRAFVAGTPTQTCHDGLV